VTRPFAVLAVVVLLIAGCQPSAEAAFRFDVVNRSQVAIVVSVVSDTAALMQGFIPGAQGTITIPLGAPDNGIGVEVFRAADCSYLVNGTRSFPTPQPFTLIVEGGPDPGTGVLLIEEEVAGAPVPVPQNAMRCPGG
jgi:hypothetical protein